VNSKIFTGKVMHSRAWPVKNRFEYPLYMYVFDLEELAELDRKTPLFGYNRIRPVSIHDKDYLLPEPGSIREKLDRVLAGSGSGGVSRVELVTAARYFNYVFNPASFFYCYRADGSLDCVVIQVNNTFGEMHLYVLQEPLEPPRGYQGHYSAEKVFFVSPFFKRKGSYEFLFSDIRHGRLDIAIHYRQNENLVFAARLQGRARPFNSFNLAATLFRHPLVASLTMPRIIWQAGRLHFKRKLPVFQKPPPMSPMTVRKAGPGFLERAGRWAFFSCLSGMEKGSLSITLPDGDRRVLGETGKGEEASLVVRDNAFFRRTLARGEIGFGESFTSGDWTSPDLTATLKILAENLSALRQSRHLSSRAGLWLAYLQHRMRVNTLKGSARNIRDHYDLGNEFFALFLDPTMTYSCALFETGQENLEEAQRKKLHFIMDFADIDATHHVLEIGCGWGGFAIEAAKERGCRVTGITISRKQLELASKKVGEAGLGHLVNLELRDYRHIERKFDRVVSLEMLEAVGHANLGRFFTACEEALWPGGKAAIQVITVPDERYESYRKNTDWIRRHIFPGGHLPSIGVIKNILTKHTGFNLQELIDIGPHYAATLRLWRENLLAARRKVMDLGFDDEFLRKWEYYFSSCEAGFLTGIIHDHQILLQKVKG